MLVFLGSLFAAITVFIIVILGLDKYWIDDTDFAEGGSEKMWASIVIAAVCAIVTLVIL